MTAKIEWDDSYLLQITEIDLQHKKLLSIANSLYDIASGDPEIFRNQMPKTLKSLTDYTVYHFSDEEQFMKKYGYPASDMHKAQHDAFVSEVTNQIQKLGECTQGQALSFYNYLAMWVLNHIAKSDRTWATFVKPKLQ